AEMAVIRLTHVADLPTPEELVRKLGDTPPPPPGGGSGGNIAPQAGTTVAQGTPAPTHSAPRGPVASAAPAIALDSENALARYARFDQVVELIRAHRDVKLLVEVETTLRLVSYSPGRIEMEPTEAAPRDLAQRLGAKLQAWTGARWAVSIAPGGGKTIAEIRDAEKLALAEEATQHPLVQAVFATFPGAKITEIRTPKANEADAAIDALPEVDEEWDPFEED
ncbi:MAG: DNA polymerase III subunit gamma/tau, partial [Pseudomonadota bacterium]